MVQIFDTTPTPSRIGESLGMGINKYMENQQQQEQQGQLATALFGVEQGQQYSGLNAKQQFKVAEKQYKKMQEFQKQQKQGQLAKNLFGTDYKDYENLSTSEQLSIAKLQQSERIQQAKLEQKELKTIKLKDLTSSLKDRGFDKEAFSEIPSKDWVQILENANELQKSVGTDNAIIQATEEYLNPQGQQKQGQAQEQPQSDEELMEMYGVSNLQEPDKKVDGVEGKVKERRSSFTKGIQSSISGRLSALMNDIPYEDYQKQNSLGDEPSFLDRFKYSLAKMGADSPYIAIGAMSGSSAGATIGSVGGPFGTAAGGLVGGGAGALAVPAMLESALEEYHKFKSGGYDGSFEDFINSSGKVLESGVESALEGTVFGILSKALPVFKSASPAFKSFLEKSKVPESVATGVIEATGLLGSKAASKGELPTKEDIADTLSQVIALNVVHALPEKVYAKIEKTKQPAEKIAKEVEQEINDKGYDKENVKHVERAITDVTAKYEGKEKEVAKDIFEEAGKVKAPDVAKEAKSLSERDIEKTFKSQEAREKRKERSPSPKELEKKEAASKEVEKIKEKIEVLKGDIEKFNEVLSRKKTKPQDRKIYEGALERANEEVASLEKEQTKNEYVEKRGVEPFSKKELKEPIQKHLTELEKAARDPTGTTAKEWQEMFLRDQKFVREFSNLSEKGKLPDAKYKDRYVKTLEVYKEAYDNMIKQVEDLIVKQHESIEGVDKRTKKSKETRKEIDNLKRKLDMLRQNKKINEAKTGRQIDKINQMYTLNKPGSPLTKQILKGLRSEVPQLQKDFIKQKKEIEAIDRRSQNVYKKNIERLNKVADDYIKNPTKANEKRLIEESGISQKEVANAKETGKEIAKTLIEKIKEKSSKEEVMKAIEKRLNNIPDLLKSQAKQMAYAVVISEIRDEFEKLTGIKVPFTGISVAISGIFNSMKRGSLFYVYNSIYQQGKEMINEAYDIKGYQSLKNPQEKIKYIRKLKKDGYTSQQIKKITKS